MTATEGTTDPLSGTAIPYDLLMQIQVGTMNFSYKGIPTLKNPFDLALYTRLLWEQKPRSILEVGSNAGGSAVWLADQCLAMGLETHIYSIDVSPVTDISHPNVSFGYGDGRNLKEVWPPAFLENLPRPLLVIEDADHHYITTKAVLDYLGACVLPGEYILVEDGILSAMKVEELYGGGPVRALREFLAQPGCQFDVDRNYCDFFGHNVTWNTGGFLRRRA